MSAKTNGALGDLRLDDFVRIALEHKLASADELTQFSDAWQTAYDAGVDGFGDEVTLSDWSGGLEAWRSLMVVVRAIAREYGLETELNAWTGGHGPLPAFVRRILCELD